LNSTYTVCPICGGLVDDTCQEHPDCTGVTEAPHPDDYTTCKHARAYADVSGETLQDFHAMLNALTIVRTKQGAIFRAGPTGLRRVR
jgi:hypothetical protein